MILIYEGEGVDRQGLAHLIQSLKETTSTPICQVTAAEIIQRGFPSAAKLFIIPGGRDRPYQRDLFPIGTQKIREFVQSGGGYLGICAGAYFASSFIEFEKGGELEVCEERSLSFYPGTAKGPAYGHGLYDYASRKGAKAAYISSPVGELFSYFNGGAMFPSHPSCAVISTYLDLDESPAIIQGLFGKGQFVLSGVHIETRACDLDLADPYLQSLYAQLDRSEVKRQQLFSYLLSLFNIIK